MPGLPKDALTYLVSFNPKIKPMRLFLITTIGRTPATILTIFLGGSIWDGDYSLALILAGVMVLLAILGFFIKRYIDRRSKKWQQLKEKTNGKSYNE